MPDPECVRPTETTMVVNLEESAADRPAEHSLGPPIPGVTETVLDSCLRPVPAGIAGDVYIAGPDWPVATTDGPD